MADLPADSADLRAAVFQRRRVRAARRSHTAAKDGRRAKRASAALEGWPPGKEEVNRRVNQ